MRIKKEKVAIDYEATKAFFKKRAEKFTIENPYSVTMYQDSNKELVIARNAKEIEKLYPYLNIGSQSKVLDIACGIGRWADALPEDITEYCGIDFSPELIEIAIQRNTKKNFQYYVGGAEQITEVLSLHQKGKYNTILLIGILVYLNDEKAISSLQQIVEASDANTILCIREPIAIQDRLTLKDYYSSELNDSYNAVYRTRNELISLFEEALLHRGFTIKAENYLFEESTLNNRKETAQYYFILER